MSKADMNYNTHTWMQTHSNGELDFSADEWIVLPIEDIATSLANTCRYTGHCKKYYSVAEHSVLISRMVPQELAYAALMHDASEAYVGDISRPLKTMFPHFKEIEKKAISAVSKGYGIPVEELNSPLIKAYDRRILADESAALMPKHPFWEQFTEPTGAVIEGWVPAEAKEKFLARFYELTK